MAENSKIKWTNHTLNPWMGGRSMTDTPTLFTLADARSHEACAGGYARFENALRKAYPDVTDLDTIQWSIGDVARLNLSDALWCLRMVADPRQRVAAIMPAVRRASKQTEDSRVHDCITQISRWLTGEDVNLASAALAARGGADATRAAAAAAVAADAAARAAEATRATWAAAAAAAARAAEATRATWAAAAAAAWAADAAVWAAVAARAAAQAAVAADAAAASVWAADAREQERAQQVADLIAAFPPTFGDKA